MEAAKPTVVVCSGAQRGCEVNAGEAVSRHRWPEMARATARWIRLRRALVLCCGELLICRTFVAAENVSFFS